MPTEAEVDELAERTARLLGAKAGPEIERALQEAAARALASIEAEQGRRARNPSWRKPGTATDEAPS